MRTVELVHRHLGGPEGGPPLVLLHGLLGSARNWQGAGRLLAKRYAVFVPAVRNHGESPHIPVMDYPAMAADMLAWLDRTGLDRVHLAGHSMGGKVAMYLACRYPERIHSLAVVDISPRAYPPRWEAEFAVLRAMPVERFERRLDAEEWLEKDIRDWAFRKFLVSNLERDPSGGFRWVVNLCTLQAALPNLFVRMPPEGWRYDGPVLFLRGSESNFVKDEDLPLIRGHFPFAELETVAGAGHNVHFDQPEAFVRLLSGFMAKASQ